MSKAIVLFSGGQDSTTCLLWAKKNYQEVKAFTVFYGQRHAIEIEQANKICKQLDVTKFEIDISELKAVLTSNLLNYHSNIAEAHSLHKELPSSYVPNRNALMLTVTHALAQKLGYDTIVTGVCQTDYSGYPDCRDEFIQNLAKTLNIGSNSSIVIQTPLMYLSKAETFKMAEELGGLDLVINESHTCYNGVRDEKHEWGYGCGECPACLLRKKGYENYAASNN